MIKIKVKPCKQEVKEAKDGNSSKIYLDIARQFFNIHKIDKKQYSAIVNSIKNVSTNKLKGGKADGRKLQSVVAPQNMDQVIIGINVESEHLSDPSECLEIVLDHLSEPGNERYYEKLKQVEG